METYDTNTKITSEPMSSVKVSKMSKGYNWEIKVYDLNPSIALDKTIEIEMKLAIVYGADEDPKEEVKYTEGLAKDVITPIC